MTIHDIAREAGVSVATVSRVLNHDNKVKPNTVNKVETVIKKMNYSPNLLGRNLRRTQSNTIQVLTMSIEYPYHAAVIAGIEQAALDYNYSVTVCNTNLNPARERKYLDLMRTRLCDGAIFLSPTVNASEINEIAKLYPVVQCAESAKTSNVSKVSVHYYDIAADVTEHFIQKKYKNIALISAKHNFASTKHLEKGYMDTMARNGLESDIQIFKANDYAFESGVSIAAEMIANGYRPQAVFCIGDLLAIGVMRVLKQAGFEVGKDVEVIGVDDITYAEYCVPSLTSVNIQKYEIGKKAVDLLIEQMQGLEPRTVYLDYSIHYRNSSS